MVIILFINNNVFRDPRHCVCVCLCMCLCVCVCACVCACVWWGFHYNSEIQLDTSQWNTLIKWCHVKTTTYVNLLRTYFYIKHCYNIRLHDDIQTHPHLQFVHHHRLQADSVSRDGNKNKLSPSNAIPGITVKPGLQSN